MDKVIRCSTNLWADDISDHAQVWREDQYGIPPPGKIQFCEKENAQGKHKDFFEF